MSDTDLRYHSHSPKKDKNRDKRNANQLQLRRDQKSSDCNAVRLSLNCDFFYLLCSLQLQTYKHSYPDKKHLFCRKDAHRVGTQTHDIR